MKDRITAALLAFCLGGFGVHKFYLGRRRQGLLYALFAITGIPFLIGFIDSVLYLVMDEREFDAKYNAESYPGTDAGLHLAPSPHQQVLDQANLLLKFKELHTAGAITDDEFEAAKRKALGLREPS